MSHATLASLHATSPSRCSSKYLCEASRPFTPPHMPALSQRCSHEEKQASPFTPAARAALPPLVTHPVFPCPFAPPCSRLQAHRQRPHARPSSS
eukprot:3915826-Pleurochrysis_carterae.AAC.2